jgi:acetoin utilization deacetylase AcuC-like enzyme
MQNEGKGLTRTGFVWDERFMWHNTGRAGGLIDAGGWVEPYEHNEHPDAKRRIKNLMDVTGLTERLVPIKSRPATDEELCYFHTHDYVERIKAGSKLRGGEAGPFTPYGTDTYDIAISAVGALIETVNHVLDGTVDNAYALLRPPGHHAQAHQGLGGCVFGNLTIATHHARRVRNVPRIAVIDTDVHHGNGVQEAFYSDPSVLTISLHQRGWYTLKGEISERGEGAGDGYSINIPLPSGSGDGAYIASFERVVLPALRRFQPDLILVAAGYDGGAYDPTSGMIISTTGFTAMAKMLVDAAAELCGGRIILEHEGGYSPWATPFSVLATIEALSGVKTGVEDPYLLFIKDSPDQKLLPHQAEVIEQVRVAFDL